ncbi:dGTP triphosphohydrolase [Oceanicaulis alexandrii]|uniref:dGTP triphosphohydrolase n=1 Tax=Oceanicaulis alexandrii TaxID=153233 RepID=UPI000426CA85|nr:dNTP triphosphohydrolase [Oceanicaulis alexandrii]
MDWHALLCSERLNNNNYKHSPYRSIFIQDYDRIVFSAPFRRLANKTQVQPLYENDHVHHRLIHSVEVSCVGRSLASQVGKWLEKRKVIKTGESSNIADIVQAACAAHDIGNPPFGHSGETAIGDWFAEKFEESKGIFSTLDNKERLEFENFEGNAQGFRILTRLEMKRNEGGMQLSKAVLGSFTKYPTTAPVQKKLESDSKKYVGVKKFGIFHSELDIFEDIAESLNLISNSSDAGTWWKRHPLVFIVEAADDICYNIVDLEDAFTTGELSFESVKELLYEAAEFPNIDFTGQTEPEQIAYLRAISIGKSIDSCFEAFQQNYDAIMSGGFSSSLAASGPKKAIFDKIQKVAIKRIFTARRKTKLEISGQQVINSVMSSILPIFEELYRNNWEPSKLSNYNEKMVRALGIDLRDITNSREALHALADFTSGMTDRYAVGTARMISGSGV